MSGPAAGDAPAFRTTIASPLGPLRLSATAAGLTGIWLPGERPPAPASPAWRDDPAPFAEVRRQLDAYFAGELREFDLVLAPRGTPFQEEVWRALVAIPFGATVAYAEVARRIGRPDAVRAVGAANGRNPIPIVIPCHRVIGSDGRLVGYGGGIGVKATLLDHERQVATGQASLFHALRHPGARPRASRMARGPRHQPRAAAAGRQTTLFSPTRP